MLNEGPDITLSCWRRRRSSIWHFSWLNLRPSSSICKVYATEYTVQYHKAPRQRGWKHKHSSAAKISCGADNCDYSNHSPKPKQCHSLGKSTFGVWPGLGASHFSLSLARTVIVMDKSLCWLVFGVSTALQGQHPWLAVSISWGQHLRLAS
jgi:hypothetical protein